MPEASSPVDPTATAPRPMTEQEAIRYAWQRARWVDHPEMLEEIEEDMCRQLSRPAPPPCPSWCTETMHDGFDELTDEPIGRQMRTHTLEVSASVSIVADEIREADDTTHLEAPFIHVEVPEFGQMTLDRARETATGLLRAAAKLDLGAVAA